MEDAGGWGGRMPPGSVGITGSTGLGGRIGLTGLVGRTVLDVSFSATVGGPGFDGFGT